VDNHKPKKIKLRKQKTDLAKTTSGMKTLKIDHHQSSVFDSTSQFSQTMVNF